MFNIT